MIVDGGVLQLPSSGMTAKTLTKLPPKLRGPFSRPKPWLTFESTLTSLLLLKADKDVKPGTKTEPPSQRVEEFLKISRSS